MVWQQQTFRKGFLGYLDEVTLERLQPVSERLAAAYAKTAAGDSCAAILAHSPI